VPPGKKNEREKLVIKIFYKKRHSISPEEATVICP